MTRLRPWLLCMALTVGVRAAHGQAQSTAFSLAYSPTQGCPTRAAFIEAIVSRTPTAHEAPSTQADIAFTAQLIAHGASATTGELWVESPGGASSRRQVGPATCPEVVESMAVIAALILAGGEPDAPPQATSPAAPLEPNSAVAATEPRTVEPATAPTPEALPPKPPPPAPPQASSSRPQSPGPSTASGQPAAPESSLPHQLRAGLAVFGGANNAVGPSLSLMGRAALGLWLHRPSIWSPRVRLGGEYSQSGSEPTEPGSAEFRLLAVEVELCPVRLPDRGPLFARPCAVLQGGRLRAKAQGTEGEPQTRTMPWFGAGARVDLEAHLLSQLAVEGALGAVALSRADTFTVEPGGRTVHDVPRLALAFSLGIAIWLP